MIVPDSPCTHYPIDPDDPGPTGQRPSIAANVRAPHVPSLRHADLLAMVNSLTPDLLLSDSAGWHLTLNHNPNEAGCLIRYPRYIYWFPKQDWSNQQIASASASMRQSFNQAEDPSLRAVLARSIFESIHPETHVVAVLRDVDPTSYRGGDLYIASFYDQFLTYTVRVQNDIWADGDPEPPIITTPPLDYDTLFEQKVVERTFTEESGGDPPVSTTFHERNVAQLWISLERTNLARDEQLATAERYRKFRHAIYYVNQPLAFSGFDGATEYLNTDLTTLYGVLAPEPAFALEPVPDVLAGPTIMARASTFFTT